MFRVAIIVGAVLLSVFYAPSPDPRILAGIQAAADAAVSRLADSPEEEYYCPMDLDVRAPMPGFCSRCGMRLIRGLREITPYPLDLVIQTPIPSEPELKRITFEVRNPKTAKPVRDFEVVHEKLYHLFVVSQDLTFFLHTHPERQRGEDFHIDIRFPKPGAYRLLSDFYPRGGGPQLIKSTVSVNSSAAPQHTPALKEDLHPKETENARVELELPHTRIIASRRTSLTFRIIPDEGLELYLGAMAHALAASADLVDMIHSHPSQSTDEPGARDLIFDNIVFARPGIYRIWIQFQRLGVVNTAFFDIPVGLSR